MVGGGGDDPPDEGDGAPDSGDEAPDSGDEAPDEGGAEADVADAEADGSEAVADGEAIPGVPATTRNRAKSAVLWGLVGGFAFLVLAQGYLLLGGDLPFPYVGLFAVAAAVAVAAGGITYLTEHRVGAKRRT